MEAGVEDTEENNAFLFAFGMIILHCSLFPLRLNINSFSFRFHFVCLLNSQLQVIQLDARDFIVGKKSI
jgi:hypothetical protein